MPPVMYIRLSTMFRQIASQAIRASSSYPWLEGGCARNVTVRGCTFIDCNCYFGAVLGNGGTLWKPNLVRRLVDCDGKTVWERTPQRRGVLDAVKTVVGLSPKITLVAPGSLPRSEGKIKRVIDNRRK